MSYVIPYESDELAYEQAVAPDLIFVQRSNLQWLGMLPAVIVTGVSWLTGGSADLTDVGFLLFTLAAGYFLTMEFVNFPRRFGIGGLVLWGGVLCWFCQDYFTHWWRHDYITNPSMPVAVIAKAAFLHTVFVTMMSIGLSIRSGVWAEKLLLAVPDPEDGRFYFWVMIVLAAIGISPYFIFTAEPWYMALLHAMFASWYGTDAQFFVYRTGNLNYSWGAYVAQIMQVGQVSGIVAIVYTILISGTILKRALGICIWTFYALVAFETGRRGNIAFTVLPPIALLFIKYQARAAMMLKRFSILGFVVCGLLAVGMQWVIQIQGSYRDVGYANSDLTNVDLTANKGNTMFSEGLLGYMLIPDQVPFFNSNDFPGEGFFVAIPKTALDFVIGIIPRALWHDKPVDSLWEWYNQVYQGTGRVGTTISKGLVGSWYFKFGAGGIIEGGLLVGWLMGLSERGLQHSGGRPIHILFSLAFATWLFRTYRDFIFIDLYGLIIGGVVLYFLIPMLRPIFGGNSVQA